MRKNPNQQYLVPAHGTETESDTTWSKAVHQKIKDARACEADPCVRVSVV